MTEDWAPFKGHGYIHVEEPPDARYLEPPKPSMLDDWRELHEAVVKLGKAVWLEFERLAVKGLVRLRRSTSRW